jgi:maltooligosyltrehalose trehalohydrolase
MEAYVTYELHVGTFSTEGTFHGAVRHLDELADLGITAVELMPVGQFPGGRNWGYDGAAPYAVQNTYGGPAGLKRFVNECHRRGLAVVLDVVYNHLGPEGNVLWGLGPYFTDRYKTPWGNAVNLDGPDSEPVRHYFVQNALQWVDEFHVDALRLDAVHAIVDASARPFLQELAEAVHARARRLGRRIHVIAESDLNDPKLVRPVERGGFGLDAVWNDDFHHALHAALTGETGGYYQDYGRIEHLARALVDGFVYTGQPSAFRRRRHGAPADGVGAHQFVVCAQNHDQIGNRRLGERLSVLEPFEKLKLAAGMVILAPNLPLLFMGEEYGEERPFRYFVSHSDPALVEAVRRGREADFAAFGWTGEIPDPQDPAQFEESKLDRGALELPRHRALRDLYTALLRLRVTLPALASLSRDRTRIVVFEADRALLVHRCTGPAQAILLFNFAEAVARIPLEPQGGAWRKVLDSAAARWHGVGSEAPDLLDLEKPAQVRLKPMTFAVYSLPE